MTSSERIERVQAGIYEYLVTAGKVSAQIARSQPVSDTMASIIPDAVRVCKDDTVVAEASASHLGKFFLGVVSAEIPIAVGSRHDSWLAYNGFLCVTNPFDQAMVNKAAAWAREEGHTITEIGVVANSYLTTLRTIYGPEISVSEEVDDELALDQLEDLIRDAADNDASDLHFVPNQTDKVELLHRIDGDLRIISKIELTLYEAMVRAVMESRCNKTYLPLTQQDGKFDLHLNESKTINLRVSTMPVVRQSGIGVKMVVRLLGNNTSLINLERLNFSKKNYELLVKFGGYPNGMLVLTGPTGSGKTTTLAAQLTNMQSRNPDRNFHTVEDPVEMQHPGMSHTEVTATLSFAQALRALLRQDPDVLLVGEMRDEETADLGYKAAMTGHLVLTTLHTNSSHESIGRLERMNIPMDLIVTNTTAFLAQRLVRTLCPHCKVRHTLKDDPASHEKYGGNKAFTEQGGDTVIYRANRDGCEHCGYASNRGEKGRVSIIEILEMTAEVQNQLLIGVNPTLLRRKQILGGTFDDLWDDGLRLVVKGLIGIDQLERELKPYEVDRVGMHPTATSGHLAAVPLPQRKTTFAANQDANLAAL